MKKWIEENWDNIVFGFEALVFSIGFLVFIYGGLIIGDCLVG